MVLILAIILAIAWWIVLGLLTAFTANPVTLNRDQILRAQYVVTATVEDPLRGQIAVATEWKGHRLEKTVTVSNLSAASPKTGKSYLIPLTKLDGQFTVTETLISKSAPLIYPATSDALQQLRAILAARK